MLWRRGRVVKVGKFPVAVDRPQSGAGTTSPTTAVRSARPYRSDRASYRVVEVPVLDAGAVGRGQRPVRRVLERSLKARNASSKVPVLPLAIASMMAAEAHHRPAPNDGLGAQSDADCRPLSRLAV